MCDDPTSQSLVSRSTQSKSSAAGPQGLESLQSVCARAACDRGSAAQLASHLTETHHPHLERRLRRVEAAMVHVAASRGLAYGNTWKLAEYFVDLSRLVRRLIAHERERFGALVQDAKVPGSAGGENPPSGRSRHDRPFQPQAIASLFRQMQALVKTDADAASCPAYQAMLHEIAALEQDYQSHRSEQASLSDLPLGT